MVGYKHILIFDLSIIILESNLFSLILIDQPFGRSIHMLNRKVRNVSTAFPMIDFS